MKYPAASIGFTLMEVLIALVILSIAFVSIFQSISSNAKSLYYLQNKTAADWVALNVIAAAQLKLINITDNNSQVSHKEVMFDKVWYWHAIMLATDNPAIIRIDVDVKQTENGTSFFHLFGYLRNDL